MPAPPFTSGKLNGLSQAEVLNLREQFGRNVLKTHGPGKFRIIILGVVSEPMFLMLLAACSLYFILGEFREGLFMLLAMCFVAAISFYQEMKSSKALAALSELMEPEALVLRDGDEQFIPVADIVPGDLIIVEEGMRVPADAEIIQANDLSLNESAMTGEAFPVTKSSVPPENLLLQGTTVNSGKCYARVTATGNQTKLGKLGKSLVFTGTGKSLLQEQISRFVKRMALLGLAAFAIIWLLNYLRTGQFNQSLLYGLTLAMSAIPEEIPVAFSSFMALGAFYMAGRGIITRQPQTIENLGTVSVICLDKTGTITENRMAVKALYGAENNLQEEINEDGLIRNREVIRYARLASESKPFDAMEKAIVEVSDKNGLFANMLPRMIHEYPLEGQPPMMTHVYSEGPGSLAAGKGAPERIMRCCKLGAPEADRYMKIAREMGASGYRVLGVCSATHQGPYPLLQDDFQWSFRGLLALYDPPKQNIASVFGKWARAGISIKLLTGDYPETAINIAGRVGIQNFREFLLGKEVMEMDETLLAERVKMINLYARMFPEAKLKVVEALKRNNSIVAMTGDGVNDGPAIKAAQIGIAMGRKGSEIAKEVSDLVVSDDNLDRITDAIRHGRKIYANLKKAIRYIISIHIPIILTASLPVIFNWAQPNIFSPIHVIFLELIMGPTCSIFYEKEPVEGDLMNKAPRPPSRSIFSAPELLTSIIQGAIISLGILLLYWFFMRQGYPLPYIRTIVFSTFLISNICLTLVNRSFTENILTTLRYKNQLTPFVLIMSLSFLAAIHFVPFIKELFGLTTITIGHFLLCMITGITNVFWFEGYKVYHKSRS